MTNYIWVKTNRVMFHSYPDAPEEVSYLSEVHRHNFLFKVSIEIGHDNRDIEFHMFKSYIESLILQLKQMHGIDQGSCEMIANNLYRIIDDGNQYPDRDLIIEVNEDGENGVTMNYPQHSKV